MSDDDYLPPPPPESFSRAPPPPPTSFSVSSERSQQTTTTLGDALALANPWARLGARFLDGVILTVGIVLLWVVVFVAGNAFGDLSTTTAAAGSTLSPLFVVLLVGLLGLTLAGTAVYEIGLIAHRGQTIGKMAVGIKVVRTDNGLAPGWGKSFWRWGLPTVVNLIPLVGAFVSLLVYVSLLWGKNRQGWHDKVAETYVVKV